MKNFNLKDQSGDKEYIKAKIRKYGKNWREHISYGTPESWKDKPKKLLARKGGGKAFYKGGKV